MGYIAIAGGLFLILVILWDVFRTLILPRRAVRLLQLTRLIERVTWAPCAALARRIRNQTLHGVIVAYFGPMELVLLLVLWSALLIVGFGLMRWGINLAQPIPHRSGSFGAYLFSSGTTFFTLATGSPQPQLTWERIVTVVEVGTGFGLLTLVIAYLPSLYQTFARREVKILRFYERAGTPSSALALLRCYATGPSSTSLEQRLDAWDEWAAEMLDGHVSYPAIAYFRSRQPGQSWVGALTTILDVCALIIVGIEGVPSQPAELTFQMARHAARDLCGVLGARPREPEHDRLPPIRLTQLRQALAAANLCPRTGPEADHQLADLRHAYEPDVTGLAILLLMPLPPWLPDTAPHTPSPPPA